MKRMCDQQTYRKGMIKLRSFSREKYNGSNFEMFERTMERENRDKYITFLLSL